MRRTAKEIMFYLLQVLFLAVVAIVVIFAGKERVKERERQMKIMSEKTDIIKVFDVWYTDKGYERYLNDMALRYEAETGVKVNLIYCSGMDYFDEISAANVSGNGPDLYLMDEKNLQTVVLLGIAEQNTDTVVNEENYFKKAIKTITYGDKLYGYPMGFDTCVFATNTDYASEVPNTFDEIKNFAANFDATAEGDKYINVSSILKWDISDVMYNYPFVGDSINVGGENRDNPEIIDIHNSKAVYALNYYNSLSNYFHIDAAEASYEQTVNELLNGQIVYTIVSADFVKSLEDSKVKNIKLSTIPDMTSGFETRALSMTDILMVNPFTDMKKEASEFARFVSYSHSEEMYEYTGNIATKKWLYANSNLNMFATAYEESVGFPKLMTTGDYWLILNNMLGKVWVDGSDTSNELYNMQKEIEERLK